MELCPATPTKGSENESSQGMEIEETASTPVDRKSALENLSRSRKTSRKRSSRNSRSSGSYAGMDVEDGDADDQDEDGSAMYDSDEELLMRARDRKSTPSKLRSPDDAFKSSKRSSAKSKGGNNKRKKKNKRVIEDSSEDEYMPSGSDPEDDDAVPSDLEPTSESDFAPEDDGESDHDGDAYEVSKRKKSTNKKAAITSPHTKRIKNEGGNSSVANFKYDPSTTSSSSSSSPSKSVEKTKKKLIKSSTDPAAGGATISPSGQTFEVPYYLQPSNIRDIDGRRPEDPEYDPRTLYIPESELKEMSPGQRQFWELKSRNMDVVLCFKMGKFYELFDEDADVGAKELGLLYMKGTRRHVGFPEMAYEKYAKQLVQLGYKVGRVEQMETPEMLKEANAKAKKKGIKARKVVRREMCSMLTKGTLTDLSLIEGSDAHFLLSLCEDEEADMMGVCFVDCSTGKFNIGQYKDDSQRTQLRTLLARLQPEEIVYPRDQLSRKTNHILSTDLKVSTLKNPLSPLKEFWNSSKTFMELKGYFDGGALYVSLSLSVCLSLSSFLFSCWIFFCIVFLSLVCPSCG